MLEPHGIILAGGLGTRMGGVLKAEIKLGGRRLLDHAIARLDPQVRALAVNANEPVKTSLPCLPDTQAGHLGPLAGVLTGLHWAADNGATHVVSVAVDTPFFPCDLVPHLIAAGQSHPQGLAVAATSDGQHGTFGIWPVALREDLTAFLTHGGRKIRDWTTKHNAALAPFPDTTPALFFNINTPEDLSEAAKWI